MQFICKEKQDLKYFNCKEKQDLKYFKSYACAKNALTYNTTQTNEINMKSISKARLLNFNRKGGKKLIWILPEFYHFLKIHLTKNYTFTVENTSMNPKYFIRIYWTNFWQSAAHVKRSMFGKIPTKICSPNLCASFGTFLVWIGQLFNPPSEFKEL